MSDTLHFAFTYWDRGWPCIPLDYKDPVVLWKAYQKKRPRLEQMRKWFAGSTHNIALVLRFTGLVVIDCDTPEDAAWWRENHPATPLAVTTGRGGTHFYYRRAGKVGNRRDVLGRQIDVRGDGGLAIVPPSVTEQAYQWEPWDHYSWDEIPVFDVAWLGPPRTELSGSSGPVKANPTIRRGREYISHITAVSGRRGHDQTFRAACKLRDSGVTPDEALLLLKGWNQTNAHPPWSDAELEHKIHDAYRLGSAL